MFFQIFRKEHWKFSKEIRSAIPGKLVDEVLEEILKEPPVNLQEELEKNSREEFCKKRKNVKK